MGLYRQNDGGGGGGGTVLGSGVANQVAYWTNGTTIGGDTGFTRDVTTHFTNLEATVDTGKVARLEIHDNINGLGLKGAALSYSRASGSQKFYYGVFDVPAVGELLEMGYKDFTGTVVNNVVSVTDTFIQADINLDDTTGAGWAILENTGTICYAKSADATHYAAQWLDSFGGNTLGSVRGDGEVLFTSLAGAGSRMVIASATGVISTQAIPAGTGFTIDGDNNMYAGTGSMAALTSGVLNFAAGIDAGNTITDGNANTLVGYEADVSGASTTGGVAIGLSTIVGDNATAVGSNAIATFDSSIAIGGNATTTVNNQCVIGGGGGAFISNAFIGSGATSDTPVSATINATGGLGTNIAGASLTIAGGKGTGDVATGGDINFATSDVGAAGTTLQSLTNKFIIKKSGDIQIPSKGINTTAGDSATINSPIGRFRKDTSGATFTLTNSFITSNSIIILTFASAPGATGYDAPVCVAGAGSAVITFSTASAAAAPAANVDVNFWVIN